MFRFVPLVALLLVLALTGNLPWVPVLIALAVVFAIAPRWGRGWRSAGPGGRAGWGC